MRLVVGFTATPIGKVGSGILAMTVFVVVSITDKSSECAPEMWARFVSALTPTPSGWSPVGMTAKIGDGVGDTVGPGRGVGVAVRVAVGAGETWAATGSAPTWTTGVSHWAGSSARPAAPVATTRVRRA